MNLKEKLEKAQAPTKELFEQAREAIFGDGYLQMISDPGGFGYWYRMIDAEAWLSAAMALVPEPALIVAMGDIAADGLPGVCLCTDTSTSPPTEHWGISLDGRDSTREQRLALALCAAAVKAHESAPSFDKGLVDPKLGKA